MKSGNIIKTIYLKIKIIIVKILKKLRLYKISYYIFMFIKKPTCMFALLKNVKHGNIFYGCLTMDKLYLKFGQIILDDTDKPVVSIIIPVFNQIEYTYKCLMSIEKYTKDVAYEVIIGDDISFDGTKFLDRYVKNIHINKNKQNTGFLLNCNNAAKIARGKYILFLNNDTEVTENWLSSLVDLIESDESIGMVGSKLVYPDGRLQEAGGIILSDGSGRNFGRCDDSTKPQYNYVRDVDYISGASIMISQKLWKKIGGFDERYIPAYCEDSDLAFEVRKAGYRVVYQPKSVVIHYEGISNGTDVNSSVGLKKYQIENNIKLKEKWQEALKKQPDPSVDNDNIKARDRIGKKGTILVIDHYVPEYDKDAGSRTTFQYLKMFVEEGYTVKFLPDNFYPNEPYTTELEQMGIEVLYGIEYSTSIFSWLKDNKENIDVVYLNRPNISQKYIDFIKDNIDIKIIYYGHDLHFLREKREYELTGNKEKLNNSNEWKEIELDIMRKADCVYYPSYVEEEAIKEIDPYINVKAINAYLFDNVDLEKKYEFNKKKGIMFVGGFNHTPNVDGIKWFMDEVYPLIKKKKNIPFTIAGSNPPQVIKDYASEDVEVTGFISDEELAKIYDNSRIVVAPLRYGAGIKGKVVEAMSKGMPIVTTSIGAEGIANTENILMVEDDPKKFAEAILNLYDDEKKLKNISKNTKKYIIDNYSTKAAWNIVKNDFSKKVKYAIITSNALDCGEIPYLQQLTSYKNVKVFNLSKNSVKEKISDCDKLIEEAVKSNKLLDAVRPAQNIILFGGSYIDGTHGIEESINRLKTADIGTNKNGKSYIICSFNSNVPNEILDYIDSLNDNVEFYLTDETSYQNFELLTGKEANYLPSLINLTKKVSTLKIREITRNLSKIKNNNNKLIGINIEEDKNSDYIKNILNSIKTKEKIHYVIINNSSDKNIIKEINKLNEKDYTLINEKMEYNNLLTILPILDTLITCEKTLIILAFKAGIIPITYINKDNNYTINNIYITKTNDNSFIIDNNEELNNAINKILFRNMLVKDIKNSTLIDKYYLELFINKMKDGE